MNQNKIAKIACLVGVAAGVIMIILGIMVMGSYSGAWSDTSVSFGGDFYSYSYKATARAGNNVDELGDMLATAFGYLLIAMGLFDGCYFGLKFAMLPAPVQEPDAVPAEPVSEEPAADAE